ncbi:diaminopimelate epimerase [Acidiferrimicrobium sp. IK]|uniref:diaminopimelate epimerase n=1 Tax=Acidiferrimicrobium sp. IK TaxID=2871700 RepID=UPI0021CB1BCA|nr:diaminopimelate epimerase [Acidiferrimicrobium sp. IK]MCU4183717.1 diaminopimelate epimerase [Acidiferrimicrobium sp. IK]
MNPEPTPRPPTPELVKLEGVGNDFLVLLDPDGTDISAGPDLARAACDRHLGFGADGLIRARRAPEGTDAVLVFELWNADGSEAEMSGNGMRCMAHAALDAGMVEAGVAFGVLTPAGRRSVTISPTAAPGTTWARVDMGQPKVIGSADRCNVGHGQLLVNMGNPHLVVAGPDPAGVDVAGLGAMLEASEPGGLNVEFATLGPGPDEVTMRVWERGVGETQACGTGSCAAAVAFHHWGRVGRAVTVHQPGGSVAVEWRPDGTVVLSGPSRRIGRCSLS